MSAKWLRSQAWDDQHIPKGLWPVKFLLRAFSSIWLAVIWLSLVIVYATLASVPIGMVAQLPTWLLIGGIAVGLFCVVGILPAWMAWRAIGPGRGALRFVTLVGVLIGGGLGAWWLWAHTLWPVIRHDPATGRGIMFFADFCSRYRSTTLRRLPGVEMTELEFYAWWPLRVILLAFVMNMVFATVRRIEFIFKNLGVLTVHTGIVVITLGSIYYGSLKREGDTLLLAGQPDPRGIPVPGPAQDRFYDGTLLSLYVGQQLGYEERPLRGIPRYNDYNLAAFTGESAFEIGRREMPWQTPDDPRGLTRRLDIPVDPTTANIVDLDLSFRVVGYASYAEEVRDWRRADPPALDQAANPLRALFLMSELPDERGEVSERPAYSFLLLPRSPGSRLSELAGMLAVEYTVNMPDRRWQDLTERLAPGVLHALSIEAPGSDGRVILPVDPSRLPARASVGDYTIDVLEVLRQPPLPIVTEGYRGATTSVAVVRVTRSGDGSPTRFTRYVHHRFPEIDQDLHDAGDGAMPRRTAPDPNLRLGYIDASVIQIYMDERAGADGRPSIRALVRAPGGEPRVLDGLAPGGMIDQFVPKLSIALGPSWEHAEPADRPAPVPEARRDRSMVGTHDKSLLAVEVSSSKVIERSGEPWRRVVWLPFTKYMGVGMGTERDVFLPDGRMVRLAFGRRQHALPGFRVRLIDFQMIAYDHRGAPRDYQSVLRVEPWGGSGVEEFEHVTKLNAPLTAPFHWSEHKPWAANLSGRLLSGLDPNQFKFSQAGWDQTGWSRTQQQADAGIIPRPYATFTILGVGNNPGIHIIALGGVMMGVGIPWAFYVKPYLVRREKRMIRERLGLHAGPGRPARQGSAADPVAFGS